MKKILFIFSVITLVACNSSKEKKKTDENISKEIISENNKEKINDTVPYEDSVMLLGKANRNGFKMEAFNNWFNSGYESYSADSEVMQQLKPLLIDVTITVFMGTWCEDSQRETPHLYKILDTAGFQESDLTLITVSEEKTTPQGFEEGQDINYVPTIIFNKNGTELGRIVEYPITSLEKDMLAILSGQEYKHAYAE
ncbi:TlpA family protein disulfide reductase [Aequorivita flava]|uniref:Thioredoxin family protein n=1 Tax=Aequorivita flava TaxID=3114371 RepID=A0AB35YR54_9FLAO